MAAYWGLFSIFALGALLTHGGDGHRRPTWLLIAAMIGLALFIGLRWEIGPDWPTYRSLFTFLHDRSLTELVGQSDPGFRGLVMLLQWQHAPFWVLNLICACIFSFGLAQFCTTLPNPWLGVLVAIPYLVIVIAMSALRQATAIGFIFLALRDMGTKPLWKSILWVLVASLFHASAFIVAVLIALSYTQSRAQAVIVLIASSIPAYYVLFGTFDIYLRRYGQHRIDSGGVAFRVAMNAVPALILLIRGTRYFAPRGEEAFWRSIALLSLALIPALLLVKSTTVVDRLSIYAIPLQILVLSELPGQFSTSSATRIYPVMLVAAYCAATLLVYFALGTHARYYLPYQTVDLW
ncbi:MAG: EpsG family protein [Sphingomonas sp.]|nr:EpsG family protein [Sphingomonas sp.]MBW0007402.1 EpsG family protein [Sphingomonas sp.]